MRDDHAGAIDLSGLGAALEPELAVPAPTWQHVNTDLMDVVYRELPNPLGSPAQAFFSQRSKASQWSDVDHIATGFREMYAFFLQHRETLLSPEGPLAVFAHQPVRYVLRNTRGYDAILSRSLHPACLRDGVDHHIELDYLSRSLCDAATEPFWRAIVRAPGVPIVPSSTTSARQIATAQMPAATCNRHRRTGVDMGFALP